MANGIKRLEYRYASVWGNPFIKILRRQLEDYIRAEFGEDYLEKARAKTELRKIKKEIAEIKKRLSELQARKAELEKIVNK